MTPVAEKVITMDDLNYSVDLIMAKVKDVEDMQQEMGIGPYERH